MSHFTVIVATDDKRSDPEDFLSAYDENLAVEPYKKDCTCSFWKNNGVKDKTNKVLLEKFGDFDKNFREKYHAIPDAEKPNWKEFIKPYVQEEERLLKLYEKDAKPDPNCEECHGTGKYETTYNPLSKWDWYEIGGRWTGYFKLKEGAEGIVGRPGLMTARAKDGWVDEAKFGDIDWEGMKTAKVLEAEENWKAAEKKTLDERHFQYGIEQGMTKEEYLKRHEIIQPFAFIDKDGVWHEKAETGWWGNTTNEDIDKYQKEWEFFFKSLEKDDVLTLFDCHI